METIAVIALDILFLALVGIGIYIERRVTSLEFIHDELLTRAEQGSFDLALELEALEKRLVLLESRPVLSDDVSERELRRGARAEELFNQGVANILGYEFKPPVKEDFSEADRA